MSYLVYVKQAIGNLFKPPVTSKYPLAPKEFCAGCRGHVVNDISKCVLCGMCERSCPAGAITVDRKTGEWKIDPFACVQCGACVAACPKKCLAMDPHYAEPAREKTEVLLTAAVPGASRPARPETPKTVHPVMPKEEHSRVVNNVMRCVFCGVCERNCPSNAIKVDRRNRTWRINLEACVNCGTCIDNCPRKCLALGCYIGKKTEITVRGAMPQRPHVPRPAAKPAAAETKPEEIKTAAPIAAEINPAPVIEAAKPAAPEVKPAPIAEAAKPIEAAKPAPAEAVRPAPIETPAPAPAPETTDTADVPDTHIRNFIEKCLFCGKCMHVCPAEAITIDRRARTWTIDREKCITCGACEGDCPAHCLTLADSWEEGEMKAMQTTYQGKVPARRPPVRPAPPKPAAPAPAVSEEKEKAAENAPDA